MNGRIAKTLRRDAHKIAKNLKDPSKQRAIYRTLKKAYVKKGQL